MNHSVRLDRQASSEESPYLERQYGLVELVRRMRNDQLSLFPPALFGHPLAYNKYLFLRSFFLNRPDYIEQVLLTNAGNYVKSQFVRRILGPLLGEGLLISEGDFWRRQRRLAAPAFQHKRIGGFVETMTAATAAMLDRWESQHAARVGEAFDAAPEMMALTLELITRTMFSADVRGEVASVQRLMKIIQDHARPSALDLFGLPQWLPRRQPKAYRAAVAELDRVLMRLLAPRRASGEDHGDLLSMLLAARDADTGEGMSDKQLRDEIMTVFLAGHETTALSLSWTWFLLAQHPDVEARLHAEVDAVLGDRAPTLADLPALKYTRMVIEEVMRLYPPAHTLSRTAVGEDVIGGLRVPPGALITISPYVTHRNPTLWPDPERFDPERFTPEQVAARPRFAYLPFGGGPRICIGNSFAMTEAQVIVAMVARRFRLRLAPGHPMAEPVGRTTLRVKNGLWVTLEPRQGHGQAAGGAA